MNTMQVGGGEAPKELSTRQFQWIRNTIYERVGIDLQGKETLVEARLSKQLRALNLDSYKNYIEYVGDDASGNALISMVDALTTNHTNFFREPQHFDYLRDCILPTVKPGQEFRIWSAACSSGEEPYSIAFSVIDGLDEKARSRTSILATDISTKVLGIAQKGIYDADRLRNMPLEQMRRHLLKGAETGNQKYMIKPATKAMVRFERLNLMEDFSRVGQFSVIFCRNVMIYFDRSTQEDLVNRLTARLNPGGYLFIGHAESLNGIQHSLQYVIPAVYMKPDNGKPNSWRGGLRNGATRRWSWRLQSDERSGCDPGDLRAWVLHRGHDSRSGFAGRWPSAFHAARVQHRSNQGTGTALYVR